MFKGNGRAGPTTLRLLLGLPAIGLLITHPAWGQVGARRQVERQLGRAEEREGPARPPGAEPPPGQPPAVADEDLKQIRAAKTVEELLDLGKVFAIGRKDAAAEKAIEAAVARQPTLLEDGRKQSPKTWNDLWFSHRARLREKKLAANDAAGRVKLAEWLFDAGLTTQGRAMLVTALALDKNLPAAKALAEKWHIAAGGPVRFDLSYGLREPLLVDTVQDEGQTINPRKDRKYLILPFAYTPSGARLMIGKTDVKATSDDGKVCPVVGLALLETADAGAGVGAGPGQPQPLVGRGSVPVLKMQAASEPLWEQLQIDPPKPGQAQELSAFNRTPPIIRPVPGQRGAPPPPPPPRSSGYAPGGKVSKPITGYAAFVLDVPAGFQSVHCSYKGEEPIALEANLVAVLNKSTENLPAAEREPMLTALTAAAGSKSAPVASAALRKLAAIRQSGEKLQGTAGEQNVLKKTPTVDKIEPVIIAAFGHESPQVRRDAFDVLSRTDSENLRALVLKTTDTKVLEHLLAELEAYFADLREALAAAASATESPSAEAPATPPPAGGTAGEATVTGLSRAALAPGALSLLFGCLNHRDASAARRALDLCLANPFDETIGLLQYATDPLTSDVLARVPRMEDARLKGAILRALLKRPGRKIAAEIPAAFAGTPITVMAEDDPIVDAALGVNPPEVQRRMFELLAEADLNAIAGSDKMRKLIEMLSAGDVRRDPPVQAALLKLARAKLRAGYQAPVKRTGQPAAAAEGAASFETVLAGVAAGADTDNQTAIDAATALLGVGQARLLHERLQRLQPATRQDERLQALIRTLPRDRALAAREALPVFLAMQLSSPNTRTQTLALSALMQIHSSTDPKQRWRVNLAVKQAVEARQLVALSASGDENVSGQATTLLRALGALSSVDETEFRSLADEAARQEKMQVIEQAEPGRAVGPFGCMIYLDVQPTQPQAQPGRPASEPGRSNIPLPSTPVNFQRPTQGGAVRVIAGTLQIGPPETRRDGPPAPGAIQINAAPLLREALETPEAQKEGLAGKIDPATLRAELVCEIKYEQLGTWSGELIVQDSGQQAPGEFTLKITGAKIVFEPLTK